MYYYEVICFSIFFIYFFLIISLLYGFFSIPTFRPSKKEQINNNIKFSILIPFKNEEKNLSEIYKNLKKQTLSKNLFEVIFINDHSEDTSEFVLKNLIKKDNFNFRIISLQRNNEGKKQALKAGIETAENDIIVTSDADCFHTEKWLETIFRYYSKHKPKMIIAPVIMSGPDSLFNNLQKIEFLSLIASTAGAAGIKHPIMCNGANLIFEKEIFNEFKDALNTEEISGDDIFLLQNIKKKYPNGIRYLKSIDATVYTDTEKNLSSFFKQRIRWASKSKSYKDIDIIIVSLIVFFTNLLLTCSFVYSLFMPEFVSVFIILFLIKTIPDLILLSAAAIFFKQSKILIIIPILSLIYPFYIIFTAISGLSAKNIKWKQVNAEQKTFG